MNRRFKHEKTICQFSFLLLCLLLNGCASWGFTLKRPTNTQNSTSNTETAVTDRDKASTAQTGISATSSTTNKHTADNTPNSATFNEACDDEGACDDTPLEDICAQAEDGIRLARNAELQGDWEHALKTAVQHAACEAWEPSARNIAFHAATQLKDASLRQIWTENSHPLAVAATGLELLRRCIADDDQECVSQYFDLSVTALENVGHADETNDIIAWLNAAQHSGHPVVAVALPLSGRDRKMGRAMLGAFLQATGIYSHKGTTFDLRFYDTRSDASTLPSILDDADNIGAKLLLGPIDTLEASAAAQVLDSHGLLMLSFAPNPVYLKANTDAFMLSFGIESEAKILANNVLKTGVSKIIAAYPEGRYGDMVAELLTSHLPHGISFEKLTYPPQDTDLRKIAQKIVSTHPDAIFLPADAKDADRLMRFVAQENTWCQTTENLLRSDARSKTDTRQWVTCLSTSVWTPLPPDHDFKFLAGAKYLDYTSSVTEGSNFATNFNALYHRTPNVYEILPYAAIKMLSDLPVEAFRNKDNLKQLLQDKFDAEHTTYLVPAVQEVFL